MQPFSIQLLKKEDPRHSEVWTLRNEVLRKPLGLDLTKEFKDDETDQTLVAFSGEYILGCLLLKPVDSGVVKLRQMAVMPAYQKKGIGRALVQSAVVVARLNGFIEIVLHARLYARSFYQQMGFEPFGTVFEEVTIPHIAMRLSCR